MTARSSWPPGETVGPGDGSRAVVIRIAMTALVLGCLVLGLVSVEGAQEAADRGPKDPAFVSWLRPDDPNDQTILYYWERAQTGQSDAEELLDLGTMLFHRGYPDDAVQIYRRALDSDSGLYEAWFRIGFVKHRQGEVDAARQAYKRCLKRRPGHGWCNFYLGLLEEQTGHPSKALDHYRQAFTHAPELADPAHNPEVLSSELSLGAALVRNEQERFSTVSPMSYLRPNRVNRVWSQYASTPIPTPAPEIASPEEAAVPVTAGTSASGIQGSAKAPQPRERRRPSVKRTPPTDTAFGLPTQRQQPATSPPTPTPQP
jgi:tetratricopeptide (TPR) repeat protein